MMKKKLKRKRKILLEEIFFRYFSIKSKIMKKNEKVTKYSHIEIPIKKTR